MMRQMIKIAVFSCFLASALSASVQLQTAQTSSSSSEDSSLLDMLGFGIHFQEMPQKIKDSLAKECLNFTGSNDAFESIKDAPDILFACGLGHIDFDNIMGEVEKAVMTDKYDSLFTKGCNISKSILPCFDDFLESTSICMDEEEKQLSKLVMIIVRALLDFTCSRSIEEFEKMAEVKEDQCILSKDEAAKECVNPLVEKYFSSEDEAIMNTYNLLTKEENCVDLIKAEGCVFSLFEECENRAPIDITRDMFRSVIDQTPCRGMKQSVTTTVSNNEI